jgi:hypothetical protein
MSLSQQQRSGLLNQVDALPEFRGAGVAYYGDGSCEVIRESAHVSGLRTYILLEEQEANAPAPSARPPAPTDSRWRSVLPELGGCS